MASEGFQRMPEEQKIAAREALFQNVLAQLRSAGSFSVEDTGSFTQSVSRSGFSPEQQSHLMTASVATAIQPRFSAGGAPMQTLKFPQNYLTVGDWALYGNALQRTQTRGPGPRARGPGPGPGPGAQGPGPGAGARARGPGPRARVRCSAFP